ncbi:MAG: hypothetical protein RUMPE_01004 [Eubacteriales bacterium SKADARSKE-1]|nr:hypothetical protein [Eubacteriales bacterium SKADARSKE-1]
MFNVSDKIKLSSEQALGLCSEQFKRIDEITEFNQQKMLKAFIDCGVSEAHLAGSTGYGYGDRGRETLDKIYAKVFGAEDAIVRHNFVCGTHALTVALFGVLRPGDTMLSVTGEPYDTLKGVIGFENDSSGSLKEFNINYEQVDFGADGALDFEKIKEKITPKIKMVYVQRSRGYTLRPSLFVSDIKKIVDIAKKNAPDCIVMVDNCYGEFTDKIEPTDPLCGADLMAGSLIKNPGGGIAPTGGYIAGKKHLVEMCSYRLTTPGLGREVGATLFNNRELFMGAFNAPHITGEALKTAVFAAALFEVLGYEVTPRYNEMRADIIQVLKLGTPEKLIAFCQGIQSGAPVDSFVKPEPWDMPGYNSKVIMAAGAFTLGASIELSADAPLREPFAVWIQGSLNFHSGKMGIMLAGDRL